MGERIQNTWIFADESVIQNLKKSDGVIDKQHGLRGHLLTWEATDEYPETKVIYDIFYGTGWYVLVEIEAEDIAYKAIGKVREPNAIIRLKMAG